MYTAYDSIRRFALRDGLCILKMAAEGMAHLMWPDCEDGLNNTKIPLGITNIGSSDDNPASRTSVVFIPNTIFFPNTLSRAKILVTPVSPG